MEASLNGGVVGWAFFERGGAMIPDHEDVVDGERGAGGCGLCLDNDGHSSYAQKGRA